MKSLNYLSTLLPVKKIIVLFFLFLIPLVTFYIGFIYSDNSVNVTTPPPQEQLLPNSPSSNLLIPAPTDKIIPIIKDGQLFLYSLTQKNLAATEYRSYWGSGASGFGEDNPLSSPDGSYVAFINSDDDYLYLLSGGSDKAVKISSSPVHYINSWSSDSSQVLYYSDFDTLASRKTSDYGAEMINWNTVESFSTSPKGFHIFDLTDGREKSLYPLVTAERFIDSHRILSILNENLSPPSKRFVIFDVDSFQADYSLVDYPITSFSEQLSFSSDASYWVKSKDNGQTNDGVSLTFSRFPKEDGTLVEFSPNWGDLQHPLLNPDATYLAYRKKGLQISEGQYAGQYSNKTILWDIKEQKQIKEFVSQPLYWISDNLLIMGVSEYGNNMSSFSSFLIYDTDTQKIENIKIK